jgi:hypothetical protein
VVKYNLIKLIDCMEKIENPALSTVELLTQHPKTLTHSTVDPQVAETARRRILPIQNGLLSSDSTKMPLSLTHQNRPERPSNTEWEINFGLLHSIFKRSKNPETKEDIAFLMANYLEKASPNNHRLTMGVDVSENDYNAHKTRLQLSLRSERGGYHRLTGPQSQEMDKLIPMNILAPGIKPADIVVLDTMHIEELLPLSFNVVPDISDQDRSIDFLLEKFIENFTQDPALSHPKICVMDITKQIGQSVVINELPENATAFVENQTNIKKSIESILKACAEKIKQDYNELHPSITSMSIDQIYDSLLMNIAFLSRAEINDNLALLLKYPNLFSQEDFKGISAPDIRKRNSNIDKKLNSWVDLTSVGIGAVKSRRFAAAALENITDITKNTSFYPTDYNVPGQTGVYMYDLVELLQSHTFHALEFMGKNALEYGKAQSLLSKATHKILTTLLTSIKEKVWDDIHDDPIKREIIQTSLERMMQHLATAIHKYYDFRVFSQAIDRAHAELTTLLLFFNPFTAEDFKNAYGCYLKPMMPGSIMPQVIGVAKSAMNFFAGVNAAILGAKANAVIAFGDHFYYEYEDLMGKKHTLDQLLNNPEIDSIDLYATEFHHNIAVYSTLSHYKKGRVIEDIKKIFKSKPLTNALTVCIDATIDFTNSKDLKKLLKSFEREIHEGRINFVIYRSGQKFDMLGLDNYFGAPYYIINNDDPKWEKINALKRSKALKTDHLSEQFFALAAVSGPDIMDDYKRQIFDNANNILNHVPESLKPGIFNGGGVSIATKDSDVHSPFIDIDVRFSNQIKKEAMETWIHTRFSELFIRAEKLTYERPGFGFAHPNFLFLKNKIRINPGLDPSENKLYHQFFKEMEVFIGKIKAKK